jgi:glucokinase
VSTSRPRPTVAFPVGIEIAESGTRISAAYGQLAPDTRVVARFSAPPSPDEAVARIAQLAQEARRRLGDVGIEGVTDHAEHREERSADMPIKATVAVAGRVSRGTVVSLPQAPDWRGFPLGRRLTDVLGGPLQVVSETTAAGYAEGQEGGAKAFPQRYLGVFYVHLGRSVTSSYARGRLLLAGAHGAEGLLGHMRVRADGPRCACGAYGHLDPIGSSQAVVRTMIGRASDHEESLSAMLRVTGGRAEAISAAQVVRLAEEGDPVAEGVLDEALNALALALANAVALLDPAVIVLGGPLAEAGAAFFAPLSTRLCTACRHLPEMPGLVAATLGPRAPLIGAQLLSLELADEPPQQAHEAQEA